MYVYVRGSLPHARHRTLQDASEIILRASNPAYRRWFALMVSGVEYPTYVGILLGFVYRKRKQFTGHQIAEANSKGMQYCGNHQFLISCSISVIMCSVNELDNP